VDRSNERQLCDRAGQLGSSAWAEKQSRRCGVGIADAAAIALAFTQTAARCWRRITGYNESLSGMRRWPARNGEVKDRHDVLESDRFKELAEMARRRDGKTGASVCSPIRQEIDAEAAAPSTCCSTTRKSCAGVDTGHTVQPGTRHSRRVRSPSVSEHDRRSDGLPVISLYGTKEGIGRPSLDSLRNSMLS